MKIRNLITVFFVFLFTLLLSTGYAQVTMPPGFPDSVRASYELLSPMEITYEEYFQIQQANFIQSANIANGVTTLFNGCDEANTPCGNGDFEQGVDQSEWDAAFGSISGAAPNANPANMTEGFSALNLALNDVNARQTLVSTGNDPITGLSMVAPGGSTRALRLGNSVNGLGTELISKRITVSANQTILSFMYATVLQRPTGHTANEQPTFWVRVVDCATGLELTNVCNLGNNSNMVIANDLTYPFFTVIQYIGEDLVYTQWLCAQINLSQHIGKTVSIQFINEDCSKSGHFGYTYIDNLCAASNCATGNITTGRHVSCGPGPICFDYTLPGGNGQTGTIKIDLNIYQNGVLLQTISSPTLSNGSNYCFNFDPTTVPGFNTSLSGYDFTGTGNFVIGNFNLAPIIAGNPPVGQIAGQNNDAQVYCIPQCCPGRNLVKNPGFEQGNQSFSTGYLYQGAIAANSVSTGRYGVMTSAQGLTVSPTWNVNCPSNGNHLYINGATGLTGPRVAWFQNVVVERGKIYKFCADMKNLPQCGFDVKPKVSVIFSLPGFDIFQSINVGSGSCNWQSVNQVITTPAGSGSFSLGIRIYLEESGVGDGNDLAIDNITLVEISQVPQAEVLFNVSFFNIAANQFSISATPVVPIQNGCGYYWEVEEVDANNNIVPGTAVYNPSQWWVNPPYTFNGYVGTGTLSGNNPGVFSFTKRYRIIYGRWCACLGYNSYAIIVDPLNAAGMSSGIKVLKDDKYIQTPSQAAAIVQGIFAGKETAQPENLKVVKSSEPVTAGIHKLKVYPNPVDESMTVEFPEDMVEGTLVIYNMQGEVMLKQVVNSKQGKQHINTGSLAGGTYLIHYKSSQGDILAKEKFVKIKK